MEAAEDRPRRRKDLAVVRRQVEDEVFYVVADPVSHEYLRLGESEHALFDLLDGTRDLPAVAKAFEVRTGLSIEPDDLAQFVDSLRQEGIVQTSGFDPALLLEEFRRRERAAAASRRFVSGSLALLKFMPFNPDRPLGALARRIRWCWSRSFCVLTGALILGAALLAAATWNRLVPAFLTLTESTLESGTSAIAGRLVVFYAVGGIVLLIHEAAHGLTLKHFGGTVPEMGFALAYFQFPGAYTDTTASYLLPSRFQRVMVSLSGGYTGLILAAAALFVWWATEPVQIANEIALLVIVMGGPLTLLFNWNPLLPYDGYYMAADILEAPNLLPRSFAYLGDLVREKIFGAPPVHPRPPVRLRSVYKIFGGLAWTYQALWTLAVPWVVFVLASRAAGDLIGGGIAGFMTLRLAGSRLGVVRRFLQVVREERGHLERPVRRRFGPLAALAAGLAALLTPVLPLHVHGAGRLEARQRREVRAAMPGFVSKVLVLEGREVEAGEPLVRLENSDLTARIEALRLDRERVHAEWARNEAAGDASGAALQREAWERRSADLATLRQRAEDLVLRAPVAGTLLAFHLADRQGTYLREGDLWGEVTGGHQLRIIVEVAEPWLGDVHQGDRALLMQSGFPGDRFPGRVVRLPEQKSPHAGATAADLAALGGEAPVKAYGVEVDVDNAGGKLRPGMSAEVRIEGPRMSLAGRAARTLMRLLRGKIWW